MLEMLRGERFRTLREVLARPVHQLRALRSEAPDKLAPSPPVGSLVLGHLGPLKADRLGFILESTKACGDVTRLRFGWITAHVVTHPDAVKHVLIDNQRNYDKQTPGFDRLRLVLGNGLVTSEGAFWKRQRRIANPAFQKEKVAGFGTTMLRCTEEQVDDWLAASRSGSAAIDVHAEMTKLTLRIAGLTLLSKDFTGEARAVGEAMTTLLAEVNERLLTLIDLPTPRARRLRRAIAELDRLVMEVVEERRRSPGAETDLLSLFMNARDEETGEAMDARQLRDEVLTSFLAGHETTANALTWSLYLASLHPGAASLVRDEVKRIAGDRPIDAEVAQSLAYTKRFVAESMRIFPPVWMIGRRAIERDEICGYPIPKDSLVFVSPWVTHRRPDLFANPEGFDPDRFLPERLAGVPRFAYFPFGGGPRICIGQGFALQEAVIMLATIMRRTRLDIVPGLQLRPEPAITLRPSGAVRMTVHPM